jgi:hypothetical protein
MKPPSYWLPMTSRTDRRIADWAAANTVEPACVPTNASWLNRIEAQSQALRYFPRGVG